MLHTPCSMLHCHGMARFLAYPGSYDIHCFSPNFSAYHRHSQYTCQNLLQNELNIMPEKKSKVQTYQRRLL